MNFQWHFYWLAAAVVSLILGAFFLTVVFGVAAWYCWPDQ